jgi:hypothetical protein
MAAGVQATRQTMQKRAPGDQLKNHMKLKSNKLVNNFLPDGPAAIADPRRMKSSMIIQNTSPEKLEYQNDRDTDNIFNHV